MDLNNKQHHKSPLFHMLHTYSAFDGAGHILLPLLSPYTLVETTKAIWTMNMNDRTDRMDDQVDGCAMLEEVLPQKNDRWKILFNTQK